MRVPRTQTQQPHRIHRSNNPLLLSSFCLSRSRPHTFLVVALLGMFALILPLRAAAQDDVRSADTARNADARSLTLNDSANADSDGADQMGVADGTGAPAAADSAASVPESTGVDEEYLATQLASDETLLDDQAALSSLNARRHAVTGEIQGMRLDVEILSERLMNIEFAIVNQERVVEQARTSQRTMAMQRTEILVEIATIQTDMADLKQALIDKALAAYMAPRSDANGEYLASESVAEAQTKMVLIDTLADSDASLIDQLAAREAALARNEFTLGEMATEASRLHNEEMLAQEKLEANQVEFTRLQGILETKIANSEAVVSDLDAQRTQLDQEIAERQAQLEAIAIKRAERRARCLDQGGTVQDDGEEIDCSFLGAQPAPGSMVWPMFSNVSSEFGLRLHPIDQVERMHNGIDLDGHTGESIGAAAAGEVFFVGWISGYGNTTLIDHGGGVESLYAHQSDFAVSEGDFVQPGQTIGYVGSTGNSTGPHLHFEVTVDGQAVDPRTFLP